MEEFNFVLLRCMKKIHLVIAIVVIVIGMTVFFELQKNVMFELAQPTRTELKQDEKSNFALHVSNQSFAIDPVDIKIFIDGKVAVDKDFSVGSQHTYISYRFLLSNGVHKIKIESQKGSAVYENSFNITDAHRGIVEYWYYPEKGNNPPTSKHFIFSFGEDKPLLID